MKIWKKNPHIVPQLRDHPNFLHPQASLPPGHSGGLRPAWLPPGGGRPSPLRRLPRRPLGQTRLVRRDRRPREERRGPQKEFGMGSSTSVAFSTFKLTWKKIPLLRIADSNFAPENMMN